MTTNELEDRPLRARGPGPGTESLRAAYLELLKLALCDLVGAGTETAYLSYDKTHVFRREPSAEELRFRAVGKDWPLHGLTMVGLTRLDDIQRCVESVVEDGIEGDLIEAGAWRGGTSMLMRATLDTLNGADRLVYVADSFQGFPRPDSGSFAADDELDLSPHDFLSAPLEQVRDNFRRLGLEAGVEFVPGFFDATLPTLRGRRWSLVRLDGDTYEATWIGLDSLYPGLAAGGYLVIDDYNFVPACRQAVDDYRRAQRIDEPIEEVDWNCVRWRRESEPAEAPDRPPSAAAAPGRPDRGSERSYARLPTERELQLQAELKMLQARIAELEGGASR